MKLNGFIRKVIPIISLALFIAIMTTGTVFKKPMSENDDVLTLIEKVEEKILNQNWDTALDHVSETKKAWKKVSKRIQFSAERDEINTLGKTLDRTEGFIKAKDKGGAMAELAEARSIWQELGK